jgi:hypothetical protein
MADDMRGRVERQLERETFETLRERKQSYQLSLRSVAGQAVLHDLAQFCRASESTFDPDPRVHALKEGRREVWLRIQEHLDLTPEELFAVKTRRTFNPQVLDDPTEDDNG